MYTPTHTHTHLYLCNNTFMLIHYIIFCELDYTSNAVCLLLSAVCKEQNDSLSLFYLTVLSPYNLGQICFFHISEHRRWIPVQETLARSLGWLWCFRCRVMVFTCIPLPLDELYEQMAWSDGGKKKRYAWQCKLTHHSGACRCGRTVLLVPSIWRADDPERTQISQNNSGADPARHTDAQRTSTGL